MKHKVRVNHMIRVPKVRVISPDGKQLGIMDVKEALKLANGQFDMDLIEVSPNADPPVCRIMDYGKYKYQMKKKDQDAKKKQTMIQLKEIKMTAKTGDHDFKFKLRHIERFLSDGNKAKVSIRFKGREVTNVELGRKMLDRVLEELGDKGVLEQPPRMEGRNLYMILAPRPG